MLGSRSNTPTVTGPFYITAAHCADVVSRLHEQLASCGAEVSRVDPSQPEACGLDRRFAMIDSCRLVIAEVSEADASVGAELAYAIHSRRIPTLCLVRKGVTSPLVGGPGGLVHRLLSVVEYDGVEEMRAAVDEFAFPAVEPGRIFVIEGGDGAGKQTQTAMLLERLRSDG